MYEFENSDDRFKVVVLNEWKITFEIFLKQTSRCIDIKIGSGELQPQRNSNQDGRYCSQRLFLFPGDLDLRQITPRVSDDCNPPVEFRNDYRRRGLMTMTLDLIERNENIKILPSGQFVCNGKDFWKNRLRHLQRNHPNHPALDRNNWGYK